ncbi:MAG: TIGR01212 family radical SAM protein [Denitrovibrio sp.]|nr:MAG: TIGR01212 family radical SAM protein [Denitrovibrio sp.]
MYYKLSDYLKKRFGTKVWKVPVDAGFSCPNRDGHKSEGGCIYCSVDSFSGSETGSISFQVKSRIEKLKKRKISKYIIYFQSYSNTYGDVDTIRKRVEESLIDEGIVALHIGTRPDVVDEDKLQYFKDLSDRYEVVIEYGLQSCSDSTLKLINRGHTVQDFIDAVELTHRFGIKTCAHLIFGLPGDSRQDMMKSVELVNSIGVHSVKFHHLHVVKGTELAKQYEAGKLSLLTEDEYIDILSEAIGMLRSDIVVSRIVGDASGDTLIAPVWEFSKGEFENRLKDRMKHKGIVQGSLSGL